jgi:hypothetical protein
LKQVGWGRQRVSKTPSEPVKAGVHACHINYVGNPSRITVQAVPGMKQEPISKKKKQNRLGPWLKQ